MNKKENNNLTIFENEEFGTIRTVTINNEPWFVGKDVAEALGYSDAFGALKKHVSNEDKQNCQNDSFRTPRGMTVINESGLYALIFGSKLESAKRFKHWVTSEVLPTIRKTGGYVNNDDLFINTYLPFADDSTKLLFSTTLETVRKQNELIKTQQTEILHKQEVINGLTDNIDIYKKRDIINRICKRSHGNYASRYRELYKCFLETERVDLEARCEGYNLRQEKKKDQLTTIKYAEKYGYIDKLYACCIKLYETEVKAIISQLNKVQS